MKSSRVILFDFYIKKHYTKENQRADCVDIFCLRAETCGGDKMSLNNVSEGVYGTVRPRGGPWAVNKLITGVSFFQGMITGLQKEHIGSEILGPLLKHCSKTSLTHLQVSALGQNISTQSAP